MFFKRKNKVIGELDFAVEVVAAAFGIELECIVLPKEGISFLMLVVKTMQTTVRRWAKAACQLVVFGAVMELHVPPNRHEQHRKGHQKGTDLQQPLFHGCKNKEKGVMVSYFCLISHFIFSHQLSAISNQPSSWVRRADS